MAKNDGAVARLSGRFPPGTKVGLYRGRIDGVHRDPSLRGAFKTQTVDKDGNVEFGGLDDDERLFIAAEVEESRPAGQGRWVSESRWRTVGIHASVPQSPPQRKSDAQIRQELAGTLSPDQRLPDRTTVGARNTRSLSSQGQPFAHVETGKPTEGGPPAEAVPHLRQEDARDVEQRSATFTGQATPVDPKEEVPRPRQDGPVDLEQRVATGVGELTPVPQGEVVPAVPQEAEVDREQRVATETGSQTPVPEGSAVENQLRKESSAAQAEGAVIPPVPVSPPRKRSQKRNQRSAKKRQTKPRTEAQKAARRKRDAARRAKRGGK